VTKWDPQTGQGTNSYSPTASNSKSALHCGQLNSTDAAIGVFIVFPPVEFGLWYAIKPLNVVVGNYIETAYLYLTNTTLICGINLVVKPYAINITYS